MTNYAAAYGALLADVVYFRVALDVMLKLNNLDEASRDRIESLIEEMRGADDKARRIAADFPEDAADLLVRVMRNPSNDPTAPPVVVVSR